MQHNLLVLALLTATALAASKTLAQNCYCDISTSCDQRCCCDSDCSAGAITLWSDYSLCANDGFAIPFCSAYNSSPLHAHDLSDGLRLIYTVIKRLFCVSRVNFVTPSSTYQTTSTQAEVPVAAAAESAYNPLLLTLPSSTTYTLPQADSQGQCITSAPRDLNRLVNGNCRVLVTPTSAAAFDTNSLLVPSLFATTAGLIPASLRVFRMSNNAVGSSTTANLVTSAGCSGSVVFSCEVIKEVRLFLVKGSSVTVDYTTSYLVLGQTQVTNPSYLRINYNYQFVATQGTYPWTGHQGYSVGSPINLLFLSSNTYTKRLSPLNLNARQPGGACRSTSTDPSDAGNLLPVQFGVNTVFSCVGTSSQTLRTNLLALFNYVGAFGISDGNLLDYVALTESIAVATTENLQLLFYYAAMGTELDPQYQIVQARLQAAGTVGPQVSLFVQFQPVSSSVVLNVPPPPTPNTNLPADFLYPFYVACSLL